MKLSTLSSKLKLLSVNSNAKTIKSSEVYPNTLTAILYLSPHTLGDRGNVCNFATEGCKAVCLYTSGRGSMNSVQQARKRKTQLFFDNNSEFINQLTYDLNLFSEYCLENKLEGYIRLNGTSDLDWQKIKLDKTNKKNCFELFPQLNFYDYTKDIKRVSNHKNYHLTFSWNESVTEKQVITKLKENINVAIVFDSLPNTWKNITVIDGDLSDLRPKDMKNVIVGLKAKGMAKKVATDFVIKTINI